MTTVLDTIPDHLHGDVSQALSWFNAREKGNFEVTGIIDPPSKAGNGQDLRLVLCGEGACRQETFRVHTGAQDNAGIQWLGDISDEAHGVAELDPPPGALRQWIDEVCNRHNFVVLLFYRGFW